MKITFIVTVYNEESTIRILLESLFSQSKFPDEIIIVDGGSTDKTIAEISNFKFPESQNKANIRLILKNGNRSVGRNEAIKNSNNEIIACSDSGCALNRDWIKNITKPFADPKVDVVAGYYQGIAKTNFQKCLIPYVLVMPDKVNSRNFLPAGRSMAFRKAVWKKAGKFPEKFSHNEDYVFANNLKKITANITFEKSAIVYWMPRENLKDAIIMFYRFAFGDAQSKIFRNKVLIIFLRYIIGLILIFLYLILKAKFILGFMCLALIAYFLWAIAKNFKYVKSISALYLLPIIQLASDLAIIYGTIIGVISAYKPQPNGLRPQ